MDFMEQIAEIEANNTNPDDLQYGGVIEVPVMMLEVEDTHALLRPAQRESQEYQNLRDSIRQRGLQTPIEVRKSEKTGKFIILNGVQRYSCHIDLNIPTIKANYKPNVKSKSQILDFQLIANKHQVKTTPKEYRRQILRMLSSEPWMTQKDIAERLNVQQSWVSQVCKTASLHPDFEPLIESGELSVTKAIHLCKLTPDDQLEFIDRAKSLEPEEFAAVIIRFIQDRNKNREKALQASREFVPVARIRTKGAILEHMENLEDGERKLALQWVLQLDPESVEQQQQDWTAKQQEREQLRNQKAAEKGMSPKAPKSALQLPTVEVA